MNNYKISVIIPVFNAEKYVLETIKSVANQAFDSYEIVIVNDGSTDDSINIIDNYLGSQNIPYQIINQHNSGLSKARNMGVYASLGEYVCFVDSDDIIDENHLISMYELASKNELMLVHCGYESTNEACRRGRKVFTYDGKIYNAKEVISYAVKRKHVVFVCGLLINKKFLIENQLYFNEKMFFGEDSDYIWKTLFSANRIGYTNSDTYKYLERDNSMMKTISKKLANTYIEEFTKTIEDIRINNSGNIEMLELVYYRELLGFFHAFSKCSCKKNFNTLFKKIDRRRMCKELLKLSDLKVLVAAIILFINPSLLYFFLSGGRHKKNNEEEICN